MSRLLKIVTNRYGRTSRYKRGGQYNRVDEPIHGIGGRRNRKGLFECVVRSRGNPSIRLGCYIRIHDRPTEEPLHRNAFLLCPRYFDFSGGKEGIFCPAVALPLSRRCWLRRWVNSFSLEKRRK